MAQPLVCGGDTSIRPHRDHGHFAAEALTINLGEAVYYEWSGCVTEPMLLRDGDVVLLDVKTTHSARQTSPERFNITFRRLAVGFGEDAATPRRRSVTLFEERS